MDIGSIVDYLNSKGQNSSYASRKKLAAQYGISNYSGTAQQNVQLLKTLQAQTGKTNTSQNTQNTSQQNSVTIAPVNTESKKESPAQSYVTDYVYKKYSPSNRVQDYSERLQDLEDDAPGDYSSRYDSQIQNIINTIQGRPKFDQNSVYDSDLYKQYREQYIQQGNKAMRDTIGNASTLTGGYGSSYAQAAGQQAYDSYLSQLGDKTLDIYDRMYNQYLQEGQELYNQLAMYNNQDSIDYGRYRDQVSDYQNMLNYLSNRYNQEYSNDFNEYVTDQGAKQWAEQYAYQKTQDAYQKTQDTLAQQNWQAQFDYQKEQDAKNLAFQQDQAAKDYALKQQELALKKSTAASKTSSKKTSSGLTTQKKKQYIDATKKLYESGKSDADAMQALFDEGLSDADVKKVIQGAGGDYNAGLDETLKYIYGGK